MKDTPCAVARFGTAFLMMSVGCGRSYTVGQVCDLTVDAGPSQGVVNLEAGACKTGLCLKPVLAPRSSVIDPPTGATCTDECSSDSDCGGERYQVMVHVDQDPLAADGVMAATLEDGTGVSAETLRRIACDCGLVAVTGNDPASMSVGRRTRSIPAAIRRALLLRDRGCCFPGCTHTRFLHGHHWRHWLHGGETSLANLLLLCPSHHRLVHEGGWSVEHDDAGAWTFIAPTGKSVSAETPRAWVGDILTWLQEWADEQGLDLGPDVNEPLWDGTRPDYEYAVSALLAAG